MLTDAILALEPSGTTAGICRKSSEKCKNVPTEGKDALKKNIVAQLNRQPPCNVYNT